MNTSRAEHLISASIATIILHRNIRYLYVYSYCHDLTRDPSSPPGSSGQEVNVNGKPARNGASLRMLSATPSPVHYGSHRCRNQTDPANMGPLYVVKSVRQS